MKPKFNVGQKFLCIQIWDSNDCVPGDVVKIVEIVDSYEIPLTPDKRLDAFYFSRRMDEISYIVLNKAGQTLRMPEEHLSSGFFKKFPREWEDHFISSSMVSTAIFEYLEKRGFNPDRKKGVKDVTCPVLNGYRTGEYTVKVEKK